MLSSFRRKKIRLACLYSDTRTLSPYVLQTETAVSLQSISQVGKNRFYSQIPQSWWEFFFLVHLISSTSMCKQVVFEISLETAVNLRLIIGINLAMQSRFIESMETTKKTQKISGSWSLLNNLTTVMQKGVVFTNEKGLVKIFQDELWKLQR